jgi:hypothetical protein
MWLPSAHFDLSFLMPVLRLLRACPSSTWWRASHELLVPQLLGSSALMAHRWGRHGPRAAGVRLAQHSRQLPLSVLIACTTPCYRPLTHAHSHHYRYLMHAFTFIPFHPTGLCCPQRPPVPGPGLTRVIQWVKQAECSSCCSSGLLRGLTHWQPCATG